MDEQPLKGRTILIVDDDAESLNIARIFLEFYGATIHTALNGKDGLAKIREVKPDMVFADLAMPKLSGWDMLTEVKSDPIISHTPIVVLTASASMGTRDKALEAGFAEYLTKPFSPRDFNDRLDVFIKLMK